VNTRLHLSPCKHVVRLRRAGARLGFTLLELVISIAIAAILSLSLTMLLNQSYASQKKLENLTQLHERATLLFTQLERDLMGATIPIENILALETENQKKDKDKKPGQQKDGQKPAEPTPKENTDKKEEIPYKPFDRVFYYKRSNNQLFFSWITDNPLQLYWGAAVGAARPRIARVMYRLEQDPNDKALFKLMRAEGFDLTYTPYEKHSEQKYKGYALVEGIKSLKITCVAVVVKKDESTDKKEATAPTAKAGTQQKKEQKPPQTEVKTTDTWEWPLPKEEKKSDEKKTEELPPLPQGIRIELVLWNEATEREVTFEYGIYIPSLPTLQREKKDEKKETPEQKPQDGKPGAPGAQPTNPAGPGGPQGGKNPITGFGGGPRPTFNPSTPQFNVLNFGSPSPTGLRRNSHAIAHSATADGNGQQMIRRMS
jgi:prepilin-type N-terminal cleavage/methylation domain-containing protein